MYKRINTTKTMNHKEKSILLFSIFLFSFLLMINNESIDESYNRHTFAPLFCFHQASHPSLRQHTLQAETSSSKIKQFLSILFALRKKAKRPHVPCAESEMQNTKFSFSRKNRKGLDLWLRQYIVRWKGT